MEKKQEKLFDSHNRNINYLRISVTDRCNLRCVYCMPSEGIPLLRHQDILTYEELLRIVRISIGLGIRKVRITGGEPLVRKGIVDFVREIAQIDGLTDLSLTTNGTLLKKFAKPLKAAGLKRINISLDTLDRARYKKITRRDYFFDVLNGIEEAERVGFSPIKINTVVVKGFNSHEILDFTKLTIDHPFHVRFIEFMPVGENSFWGKDKIIIGKEIRQLIQATYRMESIDNSPIDGPAQNYKIQGAEGIIGFINPLSEHFCHKCNRLRITPDGFLMLCLFDEKGVDLKMHLRRGTGDKELREIIVNAVKSKPSHHPQFDEIIRKCTSNMSRIGG